MIKRAEHGRSSGTARQYLLVGVGVHTCAIPLERVLEIRGVASLEEGRTRPPVVGWMVVQGLRTRVVDLGRLLGLGAWRRRADTSVLLLRQGGRRYGLLVDRVKELAELTDKEIDAGCPDEMDPAWVRGTVARPEPVVVLDDAAILAGLKGTG